MSTAEQDFALVTLTLNINCTPKNKQLHAGS